MWSDFLNHKCLISMHSTGAYQSSSDRLRSTSEPQLRTSLPFPAPTTSGYPRSSPLRPEADRGEQRQEPGAEDVTPLHPLSYMGAGRFWKPGEERSWRQRLREKAPNLKRSSEKLPNQPFVSPPPMRDLLKEAGDWLDKTYPVPGAQGSPETSLSSDEVKFSGDRCSSISSLRDDAPTALSVANDGVYSEAPKFVISEREAKVRDHLWRLQNKTDKGFQKINNVEGEITELDSAAVHPPKLNHARFSNRHRRSYSSSTHEAPRVSLAEAPSKIARHEVSKVDGAGTVDTDNKVSSNDIKSQPLELPIPDPALAEESSEEDEAESYESSHSTY